MPTATSIFRIRPERRILFARILAACVILIGDAILGAIWMEESTRIPRLRPGYPHMAWSTALCLVLLGVSLILLPKVADRRHLRWLRILPGVVAGVGVVDALAVLVWPGFGMAMVVSAVGISGYRMTALIVICILLAAVGILCLTSRDEWARRLVRGTAVSGLLISYVAILAYVFNPQSLVGNLAYEGMTPPTALSFLMLFSAIRLFDPQPTWLDAVFGEGQGARTARRLAPLVILGPLVLALVATKTTQAGLLNPDLRLMLLTAAITFISAETLSRTAQAANMAQQTLRRRNRFLEQIAEGLPVAVIAFDRGGRVLFANEAARDLGAEFGDPADWLLFGEFERPGADEPVDDEDRPVKRVLRGEVLDHERFVARRPTGRRVYVRIASNDRVFPYDAPFVVVVVEEGPVKRTPPS